MQNLDKRVSELERGKGTEYNIPAEFWVWEPDKQQAYLKEHNLDIEPTKWITDDEAKR